MATGNRIDSSSAVATNGVESHHRILVKGTLVGEEIKGEAGGSEVREDDAIKLWGPNQL
jgi:hypothetical protein